MLIFLFPLISSLCFLFVSFTVLFCCASSCLWSICCSATPQSFLLLLYLLCTLLVLFVYFVHAFETVSSFEFFSLSLSLSHHFDALERVFVVNFIYLYLIFKQLWQIYALLWRKLLHTSLLEMILWAPWAPLCDAEGATWN